MDELERRNDKVRRSWAKQAPRYDRSIGFFERRLFGTEHREWVCSHVSGDVLEVAIGTGLNIAHYAPDVRLTGIDLSPEMLAIAKQRADAWGRRVDLRVDDAHELSFADDSFDAVACTYALCNIPDARKALAEMKRVLKPDGRLVVVDHIASRVRPVLWVQKGIEFFSTRLEGETLTRRPLNDAAAVGFEIVERQRLGPAGIVERGIAVPRQATVGVSAATS